MPYEHLLLYITITQRPTALLSKDDDIWICPRGHSNPFQHFLSECYEHFNVRTRDTLRKSLVDSVSIVNIDLWHWSFFEFFAPERFLGNLNGNRSYVEEELKGSNVRFHLRMLLKDYLGLEEAEKKLLDEWNIIHELQVYQHLNVQEWPYCIAGPDPELADFVLRKEENDFFAPFSSECHQTTSRERFISQVSSSLVARLQQESRLLQIWNALPGKYQEFLSQSVVGRKFPCSKSEISDPAMVDTLRECGYLVLTVSDEIRWRVFSPLLEIFIYNHTMSKRIPAGDTGVYSRLELLRRIAVLVILIIVIIAFIGLLVIVTIQLTPKIDSLSDFLFTTVLVVSLLLGITIHFLRSDSVQRSIEKAINSNLPVPIQEPFLKFLNKLTKDNS